MKVNLKLWAFLLMIALSAAAYCDITTRPSLLLFDKCEFVTTLLATKRAAILSSNELALAFVHELERSVLLRNNIGPEDEFTSCPK